MFNIMYSLGLLIVELETSRRRLLEVFEVPDGKRTNGFRAPPIPDGPRSIGLLPRRKTPIWTFSPQISADFLRLFQRQGTESGYQFTTLRLGGRDSAELSTATRKNGDPVR